MVLGGGGGGGWGTQIVGNELIESSSELTVAECLKTSCCWSAELPMQCWFISGSVEERSQGVIHPVADRKVATDYHAFSFLHFLECQEERNRKLF